MQTIQDFFNSVIGASLLNLLLALLILIIGYILARLIAGVVRRLLQRVSLDNRLAAALSDEKQRREFPVEDTIGKVVFWLLMIFVLVAFFQRLGLTTIAGPFSAFLTELTTVYLPRLAAAAILLAIAWLVATILRFLVQKGASLIKLDQRLTRYGALQEEEQVSISEPLAEATFWFVLLLFLPAVLNTLGILSIAAPVQQVINDIIGYLPSLLSAAIIGLIGWFIARIIRQVITGLLRAVGIDRFGTQVGLAAERSLSEIIGNIAYILIMLVVIIAALDALNIAAISGPTTEMLTTIVDSIPAVLGAIIVLVLAYLVGRLVSNLLADLLANIGFNSLPARLGVRWNAERAPSVWAGWLILVVIMIFAATAAAELLGSAFLVEALDTFVEFLWRVFLAAVVFAFGLYFANLAYRAIHDTGTDNARTLARLARIAVIVFTAALALRQIGIGEDIINLAFGITLGALGLAAALAIGLGSREVAGREVERLIDDWRSPEPDEPAPPPPPAATEF